MNPSEPTSFYDRLFERITQFFPDFSYTQESLNEAIETGELFHKPADILPFLQTALMDDKFVEVELSGLTRIYFSRIYDDLPAITEEQEDQLDEYNPGDYLKEMTYLVTLPLEPGIGNYTIRFSEKILLRFFTSSYAVELGTYFRKLHKVNDLPVLLLDYPAIGRIVRGSREYRAKVPSSMDVKLVIIGKRNQRSITTRILNISVNGLAFSIKKKQQDFFIIDETRALEILLDDMLLLRFDGIVRHLSKIRGKKGTEFLCGIQADLASRAIAAKVEELVAIVQRAHLRELADKSKSSGIKLIS